MVPLPYPPDDEPVAPAVPGELMVREVWVAKDTEGLEVCSGGSPLESTVVSGTPELSAVDV